VRLFVFLPLIASALMAIAARPLARRAHPRTATRALCVSGLALAATTSASLSLLAFPLIASVPLVASQGRWPSAAVERYVPVPVWLSVLAAACIVAIAADVIVTIRRYGTDFVAAAHIQREAHDELVIVTDADVYAYACRPWPFRAGVIVISDGCLRSVDAQERLAVVAHERSHLTHHHALYRLVGRCVAAFNPLLTTVNREIEYNLERWADEDAAAVTDRSTTATALAATATMATRRQPAPMLAHSTSHVPDRVRAILDEPRTRSRALLTLVAANTLIAATAVAIAARNTETIFEFLRK
jgi:hypothetical protein